MSCAGSLSVHNVDLRRCSRAILSLKRWAPYLWCTVHRCVDNGAVHRTRGRNWGWWWRRRGRYGARSLGGRMTSCVCDSYCRDLLLVACVCVSLACPYYPTAATNRVSAGLEEVARARAEGAGICWGYLCPFVLWRGGHVRLTASDCVDMI